VAGRARAIRRPRSRVRLDQAYPAVIEVEDRIIAGMNERHVATIKRWLVETAVRLTGSE
jgi:hypothetical protein